LRALVTGGAGYIGSHLVRHLVDEGAHAVVLDDLSTGFADAVDRRARFVEGDIRDPALVRSVIEAERVDAVFHFAARIRVDESVKDPAKYYRDNVAASLALFDAILSGPARVVVLSSTAAVYGDPDPGVAALGEDHPKRPLNAYGESKLVLEGALARYGQAYGLRWAALRYFNAAGAHEDGSLRERHEPETHLVPIALEAAAGERTALTVFGRDYPTSDGTCVRDYVHVMDLATAHVAAARHLAAGRPGGAFNLGTGRGSSVAEVIACVERVTGRALPVVDAARRPGDASVLVASAERAERELGWRPTRDLDAIVRDAWRARRPRAL
jgi:UDP-glucose 4-epimerase